MADETVKLTDLKTMLQLKTDDSDDVLTLIIKNTVQALRFKLGLKTEEIFPTDLSFIAIEVCVRRYNRLANEGMAAYSQEGESITFSSNDFDDFMADIEAWKDANGKNIKSLGRVSFINAYRGDSHEV